jgi:predicted acetyltransferase
MDPVVREIRPEEYEAFQRVDGTAFSYVPTDEAMARQRPFWDTARKFGVFEGEQPVGVSANVALSMTVPGGASVPTAGVTAVGVLPTHHRRGHLTSMMHRLFEDAREHGEPLAALWASESLIYGRFGYGPAIEHEWWEIEQARAAFASAPVYTGALRMVDGPGARPACEDVWERVRRMQPGMTARDTAWWNRRFDDERENGPQFFAVYEEEGRCDGYLMYRTKGDWPDGIPSSEATVVELVAATDAAHAALWQFVFSLDLVRTVRASNRALDDAVHLMLADPRRLKRNTRDAIWLRLVDAVPALGARAYAPGTPRD